MRNTYLVTYDIRDDKRLRKVFKAMRDFGDHLQYSVFECQFTPIDLAKCRHVLARYHPPRRRPGPLHRPRTDRRSRRPRHHLARPTLLPLQRPLRRRLTHRADNDNAPVNLIRANRTDHDNVSTYLVSSRQLTTAVPTADSQCTLPDYLPARMLNEFVYCPRLFYYEWVEGVFAHNRETVEGALRHAKLDSHTDALAPADELAPEDRAHARSVTLSSDTHRLIATIDLVEAEGIARHPRRLQARLATQQHRLRRTRGLARRPRPGRRPGPRAPRQRLLL